MWWKLAVLALVTSALAVAVIPMRTHAVKYDPYNEPPPETWSFSGIFDSIYFTPTTVALIVGILAVAAAVAFYIVRGAR
jgi:hypothetical protein